MQRNNFIRISISKMSEGIVYRKLSCFISFLLFSALILANASARAQTSPPTASSSSVQASAPAEPSSSAAPAQGGTAVSGTLHGHIADQTGALIPGAQVTVTTAAGKNVGTVTADAAGGFQVRDLPAGSYVVEANYEGFAPFVSAPITLAPGQVKNIDIKMAIEAAQQQVVVTEEEGPTVSVEAGGNASAMVLKGADLDALSDDPDELSNELTALAGPSAGPNGGQIYIDGFTGGQLPPKSAIREIRINQNPFSAEFDRIGYGRIEILTKPGTDTLHGRVFGQGNDSAFNTGNPFLSPLPSYYSYQYNGTVSGPLSKTASFFFSVEQRNVKDDAIYYLADAPVFDPTTNLYVDEPLSGSVYNPSNHLEVSPRVDLQLGQKNTLTLRYQLFRYNQSGNVGTLALPSTSSTSDSIENTLQLDDSQIINDRVVNETRFEYRRGNSSGSPASTAPSVGVPGSFSGGGNGKQSSTSHSDHFELQNFTTMTAGAHAIKFGTWIRDNRLATSTNSNFNGGFTFPSVAAYIDTVNGLAQGQTFAQIAAACPTSQKGGCLPTNLAYTTGPLGFKANIFDAALFFQDDWKYNKFLTLSGGLRWESQNHIADHSDWAPRVAFAYALDGHKKGTFSKTVLRGGFGFFYDRFAVDDELSLEQFNGTANSQKQITISYPTCYTSGSLSSLPGGVASCGTGSAVSPVINTISPSYRSPYMEQFGTSLERQLTKTSTLTLTYMHSSGFHQMVTRDSNAYLPGDYIYNASGPPTILAPRPDPNLGIVNQFYPEAIFNENQLIVNLNARFTQNLSLSGFYNASWANSDGGDGSNPTNSYNLMQDYGRAGFIRPQWVFLVGNYTGKWGISYSPFLIYQGGRPYNLSTPYDLTGDAFFNSRPSYATSSSDPNNVVDTGFGSLNTIPQSGESIVPVNIGNSPSGFAMNLRISRSFGIGPKVESPGGPQPGGGGPPGGGRGGRGGGGGFGGFGGGPFGGGGGMRGGMRGGVGNTGRKYSLQFSAQALNVFNNINLGSPIGNVVSKGFGQSSGLAGGIFSTRSAARRIFIQAAFQF
jgi:Carboxypeptidase regulatory-like domain